ncbi:hypothetical protein H7B90_23575 [Cohnella xylanilytica]|uniref:Uncharacterized protein n=1 Tax=Cohnella xylanilytica TaxID=557555 RepID=A0A841U8N8_9BACL|nr:hypothetical protein [Cohnella xylanilytica]MBB6694381.1 hypothetical protein [Cohnella xylanilytica]
MDHFNGITPEERWKNDILNELRAIRQHLERNAQAVETVEEIEIKPVQRRGRRKGAAV